ncbi:MAG: hypothetical protein AB7P12_09935, partial [Alphaproteobacteria bacterium]
DRAVVAVAAVEDHVRTGTVVVVREIMAAPGAADAARPPVRLGAERLRDLWDRTDDRRRETGPTPIDPALTRLPARPVVPPPKGLTDGEAGALLYVLGAHIVVLEEWIIQIRKAGEEAGRRVGDAGRE